MKELSVTTAQKINDLHTGLTKTMRLGIETAVEIGALLVAQKAELKHGEWGKWVQDYLMFTARTASSYMRLYDNRDWVLSVRNMSYAYAILAEHDKIGNVSDLNKQKKDQATVLSEQIDKLCSMSDTLFHKVLCTNTALKELGVDSGSGYMVFNVLSSFSNLFGSVTAMLNIFGIDFIAEAQKPKDPDLKSIAAPAKKSHAVDIECEVIPPKTTTIMLQLETVESK